MAEFPAQIIQFFQLGEIVSAVSAYPLSLGAGIAIGTLHSDDDAGGNDKYIHMNGSASIAHAV